MRLSHYFYIFFSILIIGCRPNDQLNYSEDKLIDVTKDLYVASEALRRLDEARADSLSDLYNSQIESIHNVDLDLYEQDIKNLKRDNQNYLRFHKLVRDTIQTINDSIKKERKYKKK